ncbi:insulinase family protein [Candidatus Parcubacteria bacterium]|nr:insulinase family protein [Patescibacteria group bacterium]MBU4309557.1 insulinase family protein [Patescibacteria group bacterium]MBU4432343.1 insulinase family protein [Patescibacteria group bacterium]MBU4578055.1 insulinase family protein [Patescibacteria group bacterium]MCG2696437.1 insulinase family protein [Candidatus Parcubacteria bacterium]
MHTLKTLSNGVRLLTAPMRGTQTATILIMVGTGSKYEHRKNSGISHFLEHMFFKGTTKRPTALAVSSELDGIGAEFNAFTGKEYTGYWIKADSSKFDKALDVLSDMLLNSKFDEEEINREKGVIIEEYNMYEDNPMMHIEDIFERVLYEDTPAGWDTIGFKDNILRFNREDFTSYFNSQYAPKNITVCVVGNLKNSKEMVAKVTRIFNSPELNKRGEDFQEKVAVVEKQSKPQCLVEYKKTDQAHFSLGVRTYAYGNKKKAILKMLSLILGGSMSSRLFINLRERNGLAYYVHADGETYSDCGYLTTRAGVPTAKLNEAIKIVLQEYRKMKNELVTAEELKRAKDMIVGRMAIQMEGSDNVATWYSRQLVMESTVSRTKKKKFDDKNISNHEDYLKEILKVKASDIQKVAQEIFVNGGLNMAVIGPYKNDKEIRGLLKI